IHILNVPKKTKTMANISGKTYDWKLLKRLFDYARPYKSMFLWSILLTISIAIIAPLRPLLIQSTLDNYNLYNDKDGLIMMSLILIGLLILQTIVQYYHTYLTNTL